MKQLVVLLLFLGAAVGDEPSRVVQTHAMYDHCKMALRNFIGDISLSEGDKIWGGYCSGYLRGTADALSEEARHMDSTLHFNDDVTTEPLIRSFVNYVNAHPGEMDAPWRRAARSLGS